ncbi:hypothetical protein NEUTE1DRAFT_132948 [Neurospora tetrasperma FGSC 2508]|uniref:Uncharacterized protein n=1 Tax=Neurospora tetrasperma (strain FGSC 2508 / ATCC MYA-4615 / P0657) TaxID=510951 RepID=F8N104_NEUT8|nr:uncharacterized protein NEUTE1DRAFT_132948 [Neurospora tetrasperma FGSC 2508]EGO52241.1 hypothetical protein NEUTE1DRAFT_132948 [Neurospora tetrasperma FGSC 2508]
MTKPYHAPNKSWVDTWIPAIFGSAPGRLLDIPLKPKPLEQVYGLNIDSITEYTPINYDAGHDKSARSKTTNNDCTQPRAVGFSWHSQISETMMKPKVPRDSIPWKPPGEVAATKNQNCIHVDKTQIWKVQNTLQFTRKSDTYSLKRKKYGYTSTMRSRRLNELRTWKKALEGRQCLRRKGRSKAGTKSIEKYLKANSGNTVQSNVQWPDQTVKIGRLFIYVVGFAAISASCVGIGIVIFRPLFFQGHYQRDTVFSTVTSNDESSSSGKASLNNPQCRYTPQRLRKARLGLSPGGGNDC